MATEVTYMTRCTRCFKEYEYNGKPVAFHIIKNAKCPVCGCPLAEIIGIKE